MLHLKENQKLYSLAKKISKKVQKLKSYGYFEFNHFPILVDSGLVKNPKK